MAASAQWNIESARETVRVLNANEPIGDHEPRSILWYAYLAGRMSAQIESLCDIIEKEE